MPLTNTPRFGRMALWLKECQKYMKRGEKIPGFTIKDMDLSPEDYREALKALWGNVEVHKPEPQEDKQEKPEGTWNE